MDIDSNLDVLLSDVTSFTDVTSVGFVTVSGNCMLLITRRLSENLADGICFHLRLYLGLRRPWFYMSLTIYQTTWRHNAGKHSLIAYAYVLSLSVVKGKHFRDLYRSWRCVSKYRVNILACRDPSLGNDRKTNNETTPAARKQILNKKQSNYNNDERCFLCGPCRDVISGAGGSCS
jgi:hypothetical protein